MKKEEFSADKFKEWFDSNTNENFILDRTMKLKELIGKKVESNINSKKTSSKMTIEHGDRDQIVQEFIENGGEVVDIDGKTVLIEVNAGSFYIHKNYIIEA